MAQLPGVDLAGLTRYLATEHPGLVTGPLTAELITGGRSNLTYRLRDDLHRWVLRRPPLGHVLATAHDMTREYRVIGALADTVVPVPGAVLLCADPEVLGAPFYVMHEVPGTVYRASAQLAALGPQRSAAVGHALIDTLADLHLVPPGEVGLAGFGRPEGFLERQLRRWSAQLSASTSRPLPGMTRLHEWLVAHLPPGPGEVAVIHGDFRLDNLIYGADDRVAAVLDWEMSTLGDPLSDLGLLAVYQSPQLAEGGPVANATGAPGFPPTGELIQRYAARTGRDVSGLGWYVAFGHFKLAVILEGIHYRFGQGQTVGEGFDLVGDVVPALIAAGLDAAYT